MTVERVPPPMRASDAERAEIARALEAATAAGRLTVAEADERLAACYSARYRHELGPLVEDLPTDPPAAPARSRPARSRPALPLVAHATVVSLLSVLLIVAWVGSGAAFFWPIWPMFWLGVSLVAHARFRAGRSPRWSRS
jgi:uncharacterized protein DUF1707